MLAALVLSAAGANASATIKFNAPADAAGKKIVTSNVAVKDLMNRNAEVLTDTITLTGLSTDFPTEYADPMAIRLTFENQNLGTLFLLPGETATVTLSSTTEPEATVSGTPLMDDLNRLDNELNPIVKQIIAVRDGKSDADADLLSSQYDMIVADFIAKNPESPASPYALTFLSGDLFMTGYNSMKYYINKSIFKDMIEATKDRTEMLLERERAQKEMQSGHADAPDFTLKNLEGKDVSLSDFRGKWVIIDFWGSWCGWCIKGFPELKKAYKEYDGKVEVLGVDCGDSDEAWRAAVKRFELPWVNVYNPSDGNGPDRIYNIQGYPTKVIVTPEGKIAKIVTGEDPSFYDILSRLVNQ